MRYHWPIFSAILALMLGTAMFTSLSAQSPERRLDMGVAGVRLADRDSARRFLDGYQYRTDQGVPTYYFYNSKITTVLKLTGLSYEDPYYITEIEVYNVGPEYQYRHFVLEKLGHFVSEAGVFVGFRQSGKGIAIALATGFPNLARDNVIGPKDLSGKLGEPSERQVNGSEEILIYSNDTEVVPPEGGAAAKVRYTARYRFYDRKLNRFLIRIEPVPAPPPPSD
ncbi:MAG: hypothetical protein KF736_01080 [Acidobacteria bacterium]|nr:hypothetical protein [Acidobacteriota bacterium]MCW5948069.1 hypothetical protein [Pyrinomonadaceae bacterium]